MIDITKDWCLNMAAKEGDAEIGAGAAARDPVAPYTEQSNQKCSRCGAARREHIWRNICPVDGPTQWFKA
jgi:hypothetical protein